MRCPHCGNEVVEKPKTIAFPATDATPDAEFIRKYIEQLEKRRRQQMDPLDARELQR